MLVAAATYGLAGVFGKLAFHHGMTVLGVLFWRFLVAALWLAAWVWLSRGTFGRPARALRTVAFGAVVFGAHAALYFSAISRLGVALGTLVFYTYPALVLLVAGPLNGDRPTKAALVALVLSLTGCTLTLSSRFGHVEPAGIALGLAAAVLYSVHIVWGSRDDAELDPMPSAVWLLFGAALSIGAAGVVTGKPPGVPPAGALGVVLALGVLATAVPVVASFEGMRRLGACRSALTSAVSPLVALTLGVWVLHESMGHPQWLGAGLILGSTVLTHVAGR